jgi:probable F420-dependent oxidoreductase
MKYGLHLAGGALVCGRKELREVATVAEELDFDSILIGDHIVNAKNIGSPWPYTEYYGNDLNQLPFSIYTEVPWLDPFDTLAFLAAATEKARLGLSVLIVPYRNPYDVARRVATLDVLSGGRMILGVGVGWMEEEFQLLGIPFKERAQRTREYIAVMKAVWTQENPRFDGQFIKLDRDVNMLPLPLQKPHPPIWVGGETTAAMRRVAEFGDGWHIALLTIEQIRSLYERLRGAMDKASRDFTKLEFTAMTDMSRLSPGVIESYRKLNVSTLYMLPLGGTLSEFIKGMRDFAGMMRDAG